MLWIKINGLFPKDPKRAGWEMGFLERERVRRRKHEQEEKRPSTASGSWLFGHLGNNYWVNFLQRRSYKRWEMQRGERERRDRMR